MSKRAQRRRVIPLSWKVVALRQHPDLLSALWPLFTVPPKKGDRSLWVAGASFSVKLWSWQRDGCPHLQLRLKVPALPSQVETKCSVEQNCQWWALKAPQGSSAQPGLEENEASAGQGFKFHPDTSARWVLHRRARLYGVCCRGVRNTCPANTAETWLPLGFHTWRG